MLRYSQAAVRLGRTSLARRLPTAQRSLSFLPDNNMNPIKRSMKEVGHADLCEALYDAQYAGYAARSALLATFHLATRGSVHHGSSRRHRLWLAQTYEE